MSSVSVPADLLGRQTRAILAAWGMPAEAAAVTADRMVEADLRGVDSHGVAMFGRYEELLRAGSLVMAPVVRTVRETPVTALVDGGGGLGHHPATLAMDLAVAKCRATGVAVTTVRNSSHFGAAGVYAVRAAAAGFIGMSCTSGLTASVVPTFAAEAMLGTNPWAFAAPAERNPPFVLDMATSTVAIGKVRLAALAGKPVPEGWTVDADGRPLTDPVAAMRLKLMTPLGGSREQGSHKGYGLAAMVEILGAVLSGARPIPLRGLDRLDSAGHANIGHFFLALDPEAFRDEGEFERDLDAMIDALHGARRADPNVPVLVAGDPEIAELERRRRDGVPLPAALVRELADIAARAGAAWLLQP